MHTLLIYFKEYTLACVWKTCLVILIENLFILVNPTLYGLFNSSRSCNVIYELDLYIVVWNVAHNICSIQQISDLFLWEALWELDALLD